MSVLREDAYLACKIGRLTRDEPSESEISQMQRRLDWFAARLSQGAQTNLRECTQWSHGAQGEAVVFNADGPAPDGFVLQVVSNRRIPDGTKLYTHPAERAAVPDVVFQNLAQIADGGELSRSDMQDMACEAYNLLRRALTAAPQPPEGARVDSDG